MGIKTFNPYTPSRRAMTMLDNAEITKAAPEKSLTVSLKKTQMSPIKTELPSDVEFSDLYLRIRDDMDKTANHFDL